MTGAGKLCKSLKDEERRSGGGDGIGYYVEHRPAENQHAFRSFDGLQFIKGRAGKWDFLCRALAPCEIFVGDISWLRYGGGFILRTMTM